MSRKSRIEIIQFFRKSKTEGSRFLIDLDQLDTEAIYYGVKSTHLNYNLVVSKAQMCMILLPGSPGGRYDEV